MISLRKYVILRRPQSGLLEGRPSRNAAIFGANLLAVLIVAVAVPCAGAQTATSTSGNVGSAASRSSYPTGGGAIVLPTEPASPNAATTAGATPAIGSGIGATGSGGAASSTSGSGGSAGGGRTGTASAGRGARSSGGGGHWVLCPPTGSSGLSPLFTGTDLACTPD